MDEKLRTLADYLLSCRSWVSVRPSSIGNQLLPSFFVLDIERIWPSMSIRLKVRVAGTRLDVSFGYNLKGCYWEDIIHGSCGGDVVSGFKECAEQSAPVWMRHVIQIRHDPPRNVEALAVYLAPDRIYGALLIGGLVDRSALSRFEIERLAVPVNVPA